MSALTDGPSPAYLDALAEIGGRLADGGSEVLRDVLLLLGPQTERAVRRQLGTALSDADYEDAMSMALFRLWRRRDRFDPSRARLDRWFYLLARNAAIDLFRAKRRRKEQALGEDAEQIPERKDDRPIDSRARLHHDLKKALDAVSDVDKRILTSGLTETELSQELHKTPGAIRVRRLRAKRKILSVLRDMGHIVTDK